MIAVASGKGGTGKTTVTVGLAAAIGKQRGRALAVDADVEMPNLHAVTGVDREPPADGRSHKVPGVTGVSVHPAPTRDLDVREHLARFAPDDGVVLVDCPAGASRTAVEPLRVADEVLLVTTPNENAVRDTLKTAAMARTLDTPVVGVVLNQVETPQSHIERCFEAPTLACVPIIRKPRPTSIRFTGFLDTAATTVRRLYDTLKLPD